jgi:hypothetical protein
MFWSDTEAGHSVLSQLWLNKSKGWGKSVDAAKWLHDGNVYSDDLVDDEIDLGVMARYVGGRLPNSYAEGTAPFGSYSDAVNAERRRQRAEQLKRDIELRSSELRRTEVNRLVRETVDKIKAKENTVSVEQTVEDIIRAKQKQKEVDRRLAWIEAQGDDTYADGTIVRFEKKLRGNVSMYVAIKANGHWSAVSGNTVATVSAWSDFLLWLSEDNPEPTLYQQKDAYLCNPIEEPAALA